MIDGTAGGCRASDTSIAWGLRSRLQSTALGGERRFDRAGTVPDHSVNHGYEGVEESR